ncbi:hypothetical protein O6H91_02G121400 [Diphasiastrum complanatum]|uniref:Uncharacterized protein n=1 Tax=Diphasiastrum complanatum TaxID=34168 RepID=A0ACC2EK62_DIPCM|nr:hypothetical protein O6H91_02G121400 [Diphasiastrum complanatum]
MAQQISNSTLLAQIAEGSAEFEVVQLEEGVPFHPPFAAISQACFRSCKRDARFFARIGPPGEMASVRQATPPALRKVEHYTVHRVEGDGRCLFRALKLLHADQLRLAVMDVLCKNEKRRQDFEEALIAITVEESMKRYCQRISNSNFWGGESELLVLSKMCGQPIIVYIPEAEVKKGIKWRLGYIPIAEYGSEFTKSGKDRKPRKPVRLLYSGGNHYDLLI